MSYYNASRILTILQRATGQGPDDFLKWAEQQKPNVIQDKLEDIANQLPPSVGYNFKNSARGLLKSRGIKLPTADNGYDNKQEHPAYKKEEIIRMLSYLQDKRHKLFALLIYESGFRPHHVLLMEIRHIKNDLDNDMIPTAIQLDPEHYKGKKAAGYAFLGRESIKLLKECQDEGKVGKEPTDRIMTLHYSSLNEALRRAKRQAKLNEAIQPSHGLRKAFEYALDKAGIDHDLKMRIEGHNNGTRGKAYTTKDADELRPEYLKAYPWIDLTNPTGTKAWTELKKEHKTAEEATSEMQELREKLNAVLQFLKTTTGLDLEKASTEAFQHASKRPRIIGELMVEGIHEKFNTESENLATRFEALPKPTQEKYEKAFQAILRADSDDPDKRFDNAEAFLKRLETKTTKILPSNEIQKLQ
jgi:integrase